MFRSLFADRKKVELIFSAVDRILTRYLRRELSILELDDAEYFHYKDVDDVKFMSTIIECENDFMNLQKTRIQAPDFKIFRRP